MNSLTFIRAFWGDLDNFNQRHRYEIIESANNKNLNEVVFVWGADNYKFIQSLGFNCKLISPESTQYGNDYLYDSDKYMIHKLIAIKMGVKLFGEVVFLDWDCKQLKPIDNRFYELIKESDSEIQMPLYVYPNNYSKIVLDSWKDIPLKEKEYVLKQQHYLEKYNYDWNNSFVTPNAGFVFCSNSDIMDELIHINETQKIGIASEEMAMVEYSKRNCKSVTDYIKRYEPIVCNAKLDDHFNQRELNELISTITKKDLYFQHI